MGAQFKQRQGLCRATFDFGEDELAYSFDNSRVKAGGSVPYHKIPGSTLYREIKMWWLKYFAVFAVTGWAIAALQYSSVNDLENLAYVTYAIVLMFLCISLAALLQRNRGMTGIRLDPALYVLHDGQQNSILDEITRRRLSMMKEKLAHVDFHRPYYEEARKFKWLREEGVISDQEHRYARQQIAAMRDKAGTLFPGPGRVN